MSKSILELQYPLIGFDTFTCYNSDKFLMIKGVKLDKSKDIIKQLNKFDEEVYFINNLPELLALPKKKMLLVDYNYNTFIKNLTKSIYTFTVPYENRIEDLIVWNGLYIPIKFEPEIENSYFKIAIIDGMYFHIGYELQEKHEEILF